MHYLETERKTTNRRVERVKSKSNMLSLIKNSKHEKPLP